MKKVCYKVSLCENCQRQSCKAFIGPTTRAKMIGGGRPLLPEILYQSDRVGVKSSMESQGILRESGKVRENREGRGKVREF